MPALRLVFLVAIVVGVLAAIAASTSQQRTLRSGESTTTMATPPARQPSRTITAKLPRKTPIEASVGDLISVQLTLKEGDTVALDAFGFEEGVASNVPTTVRIMVTQAGRYKLIARESNTPLVEIVATRPELLKAPAPKAPAPSRTTPADPSTAVSAAVRGGRTAT